VLAALLFRVEICEFLFLGVGLEGLNLHGLGALEQLDGLALENLGVDLDQTLLLEQAGVLLRKLGAEHVFVDGGAHDDELGGLVDVLGVVLPHELPQDAQ